MWKYALLDLVLHLPRQLKQVTYVHFYIFQKEEAKRKEKIEDWERHQRGGGYRSKYKPPEVGTAH